MNEAPLIELRGIAKTYGRGDAVFHALRGVDLRIDQGEFVAIMGPSGSGKSTLMNLLGCLDTPSDGHYELNGKDVARMSERAEAHGLAGSNLCDPAFRDLRHHLDVRGCHQGHQRAIRLDRASRQHVHGLHDALRGSGEHKAGRRIGDDARLDFHEEVARLHALALTDTQAGDTPRHAGGHRGEGSGCMLNLTEGWKGSFHHPEFHGTGLQPEVLHNETIQAHEAGVRRRGVRVIRSGEGGGGAQGEEEKVRFHGVFQGRVGTMPVAVSASARAAR